MKKIIAFILIAAICLSLSSCNLDFAFGKYDYTDHTVATAAPKATVSLLESRQEGYLEFLDKIDRFAAKLTYEVYLDKNGSDNLAISPISIYMALALATECADGETRQQILDAVGVSYDEISKYTKYLYSLSNQRFYAGRKGSEVSSLALLSNSIWADDGVKLKDAGVNNLANNYNCDLYTVDFGRGEANKAINSFVKDKTYGVIDGGIDLSPETLITLINTFYLKEIWNVDGDELSFTNESYAFVNIDGTTKDTKLLKGYYNNGRVYEGEGYTSFYTTTEHNYNIKFIVPKDGYTLNDVFTAQNIYDINNVENYGYVDDENMLLHHTRVFFPEYEASFDNDISNILREGFGIENLFDSFGCDFSNITDEPVCCDGVIHKCKLEVNKKGIEGAAVTYIPMNGASAGPGEYKNAYHDYIVDRAFGYVITDNSGAVLFSGVVNGI